MHAEIDAAGADQERQHDGEGDEIDAHHEPRLGSRQKRAERQIGDGREHGVSARKGQAVDVHEMSDDIGPLPVEEDLQDVRQSRSADHRPDHEKRRGAFAVEQEIGDRRREDHRQDGISAERRDVAQGSLQPERPDRVVHVARLAQGAQDRVVERVRVALAHLARNGQEAEQRTRQAEQPKQELGFDAPQDGKAAKTGRRGSAGRGRSIGHASDI